MIFVWHYNKFTEIIKKKKKNTETSNEYNI